MCNLSAYVPCLISFFHISWGQIQRKLQLRIEEQGKQLRMMFEQQQKTSKAFLSSQNDTSLEDDHFPVAEGSENTHFPSKVS